MLRAFGHPVATCCHILGIENRTSAHARRVQHFKFEPTTPNMSQHVATGGETRTTCGAQQCCDMLR